MSGVEGVECEDLDDREAGVMFRRMTHLNCSLRRVLESCLTGDDTPVK
jgi:hypothetical protein